MYSEKVLDHFHHPRHAGEISQPSLTVEVTNPVCGDVLKVWLRLSSGRVDAAKFKVAGCVPAVACGSWLAEWIQGKTLAALTPVSPSQIEEALGGLPAASKHASALASEALNQLLAKLAHEEGGAR
ncbi:MAG: iron-sulfur cluster assembly scaffold protein [Terriglobia bacterium]